MNSETPQPDLGDSSKDDHPTNSSPQTPLETSTPTMNSENSDTVLINSSDLTDSTSDPTELTKRPPPPSRASTLGIKKCWICICDSTEDDPDNPPVWRSPCACNLTAHESCLLDWVADLENPKKGKKKADAKILCPQCKSEIKIARPKSYVLDGFRIVDRSLNTLILPGLGASVLGTVFAGAWVQGFYSVWVVFGREEAARIFKEAQLHNGWRWAYALIPANLIFARTSFAQYVLPTGTLFLLHTQISESYEIDMTVWPPLPSTVFACLPAIRSTYNWAYNKAFGELNKRWLEEIAPMQETPEGQERNMADIANAQEAEAGDGGLVLQLEVNLGAEDDDGNEEQGQAQAEGEAQAGPADNENNGNQPDLGDQQQNGHVHHILGDGGQGVLAGAPGLSQIFLGALTFPAVAAGMGSLLSYVIPNKWMTSSNWMNGRYGLLRHRWGRSVVGGCLFVVLKDALILYCRWRMAVGHRHRRIMDYDKQTKKYIS